jgi:hypothetical protein
MEDRHGLREDVVVRRRVNTEAAKSDCQLIAEFSTCDVVKRIHSPDVPELVAVQIDNSDVLSSQLVEQSGKPSDIVVIDEFCSIGILACSGVVSAREGSK